MFCPEPSSKSSDLPTPPVLYEGTHQALQLESTLQDLPRYQCDVELDCPGWKMAQVFEQHPPLPGAVLMEQGQFAGMLSRQQLLELLIRPYGMEIFLKEPLRVLHSYARREFLLLSGDTPIIAAAPQALRRSPELLAEPILLQTGSQDYYLLDIHALNIAYWQIRGIETQVRYERAQAQMIQSDKMASLGRLVDGVAHEILDPVSFIWGNLSHVSTYCEGLLELLTAYENHLSVTPAAIAQLKDDLEIDYLREDLPQAIDSIRTGAERLTKLATSLQNFCHIDEVYPKPVNLHDLIDSILLLLKSRLTSEIQIVKHYGHLPPVPCFAGQMNQVLMNILSHAVDALLNQAVSQSLESDLKGAGMIAEKGFQPTIEITTDVRSISQPNSNTTRWVSIRIADNSPGLSVEAQQQIWESFSVKQRAEKETSLAMSYQIITAKHGGRLEVRSREATKAGTGTEFQILLPLL